VPLSNLGQPVWECVSVGHRGRCAFFLPVNRRTSNPTSRATSRTKAAGAQLRGVARVRPIHSSFGQPASELLQPTSLVVCVRVSRRA
jgi:hypothetical protein